MEKKRMTILLSKEDLERLKWMKGAFGLSVGAACRLALVLLEKHLLVQFLGEENDSQE